MNAKKVHDKVFFLGAGFSKGIYPEYPLMKELTDKIREHYSSGKTEQSLTKHYETIPEKTKNNVEELLSYLSGKLIWKDEITFSLDNALYSSITKEIRNLISDIDETAKKNIPNNNDIGGRQVCRSDRVEIEDTTNDDLKQIINFIDKNNSPVITLNYDMLIENTLSNKLDKGNPVDLDLFYQIPITNKVNRVKQITLSNRNYANSGENRVYPHLLKLHGSVNWLYQKNNVYGLIYYEDKIKEAEAYIHGHFADRKFNDDLVPFIIPPVLVKDTLFNNNILKILWMQAHKYLAYAKEIYIIGFSFPQTDLYVKFLFQSALKDNKDVKVYVINNDTTESLKCRYKDAIGEDKLDWDFCIKDNPIAEFVSKKLS